MDSDNYTSLSTPTLGSPMHLPKTFLYATPSPFDLDEEALDGSDSPSLAENPMFSSLYSSVDKTTHESKPESARGVSREQSEPSLSHKKRRDDGRRVRFEESPQFVFSNRMSPSIPSDESSSFSTPMQVSHAPSLLSPSLHDKEKANLQGLDEALSQRSIKHAILSLYTSPQRSDHVKQCIEKQKKKYDSSSATMLDRLNPKTSEDLPIDQASHSSPLIVKERRASSHIIKKKKDKYLIAKDFDLLISPPSHKKDSLILQQFSDRSFTLMLDGLKKAKSVKPRVSTIDFRSLTSGEISELLRRTIINLQNISDELVMALEEREWLREKNEAYWSVFKNIHCFIGEVERKRDTSQP
ncbi:hypothetical protein ADUPG1_006036 [Aduncisulcus paluster]|uniref:Uncharacterized protein n=1 Tax=Aduncisulcus paluster TaxID=2918883 RepID=A0ABQ5KID2_9EUKA|nr:hypothetical protein ADUPG1_006036 [Aduncisulcus paluster]|eukprot:gnl/Carplike_NY0171/1803_a2440_646.p1 GENE.gnl/Carplike_NY0171/1803_a2440_646~~gnl/Carplike_NY0171/1803_a2440_646.p1  ORF type:complete len:355 (+),score=77.05 gnl/Carplike_NY0171/1803_a2440_646:161-1225(+)